MQLYAFSRDEGFPSPAVLLVRCGTHPGLTFWLQGTCQVYQHLKETLRATQPFPWFLSTDFVIVPLWKVEIARLDHSQGPLAALILSDSSNTRCFRGKWKESLEHCKLGSALRSGKASSALAFAFSYPSRWFSVLSNINVGVFHHCETAFLGVISLH